MYALPQLQLARAFAAYKEVGNDNKSPQAISVTQRPPVQLRPCPEPARAFPANEYTGPGSNWINPPGKQQKVPRGLDGRPCSLNPGEKFNSFARTIVNGKTYVSAGYNAGIAQWEDNDPEWGQGAQGYGKRYAAAYADQLSINFFRKFAYPVLFRQDPRYFRSEERGAGARLKHAIAHTFVTKSDDGDNMFNFSEWFGVTSTVALANLYHPGHKRGFTPAAERVGTHVGTDMGLTVVREFWPEIARKFHLPFHRQ